ncbi:LysR family transcriptional regulator [Nitrosomonas sp. Nm33]|uniref:LysR family transcriptional regulator n=1 Tax=Nitrosomonas sp. Nm33 TaxID=133724 RepID=UPI00089C409A|nr:LysR family transcriptional regulator [Nitrosomonas sp. Nm33]SDY01992.1 DNA-binding transcriptional regulator, LysR family [Nitrosomonas sp. Nm33]
MGKTVINNGTIMLPTLINLNDLVIFEEVIRTGGFSAAARKLNQPKASVSRAIQRLEDDLAVRLIQRTTRSLRLTEAGVLLYEQANASLEQIGDVLCRIKNMHEQPEGHLKITMPIEFGMFFMGSLIADFMQLYPQVYVQVDLSSRLVNLIEEGFDLALRMGASTLQDSSLVAKKLSELPLRFYASPYYLGKYGRPDTLQALTKHESILFRHTHQQTIQASCLSHKKAPNNRTETQLHGKLSVDHYSVMKDAAVAGAGIALMPPFMCHAEVLAGQLLNILEQYVVETDQLFLVYPTRKHQSAAVKILLDFMTQRLLSHPLLNPDQ